MSTEHIIFSIEAAPGDAPLGAEQPNGDLLLPARARPLVAKALLQAECALGQEQHSERAALIEARRLLGIEPRETTPQWLSNLYKVRPI